MSAESNEQSDHHHHQNEDVDGEAYQNPQINEDSNEQGFTKPFSASSVEETSVAKEAACAKETISKEQAAKEEQLKDRLAAAAREKLRATAAVNAAAALVTAAPVTSAPSVSAPSPAYAAAKPAANLQSERKKKAALFAALLKEGGTGKTAALMSLSASLRGETLETPSVSSDEPAVETVYEDANTSSPVPLTKEPEEEEPEEELEEEEEGEVPGIDTISPAITMSDGVFKKPGSTASSASSRENTPPLDAPLPAPQPSPWRGPGTQARP